MATSNDNLRKLYQNGLKHFSLPDFDTFERDMKDEVKRQRFYTNMQAAYSLPDFDTFSKDIGVVATDSPTPVKPATQTPAQSQERVTSITVKPLTDTTPQLLSVQQDVQPITQPAKPEGWEPSPMQHRAFQMQMDEANARLKKMGEDFQQRMEGIEKGNRPGAFMGEREFNPQTGQMGTHYYTQKGERVGSRMEQSRRNSAHRQWWENNTEAGRRSKEQRLQREFDARLSGLWQRHNPKEGENAAEMAWSAAEKRQGIDANRIADDVYHDRGDAISNMVLLGGPENHIMNASENRQRSMVAHFTNFDLDRLMNESWDNLGEDGQKALIDDCYQMLRYRNPGADELVLYNQAKQFARQQSDLRLYNLAVEKNLPKGNLEYLMRKIGDMNVLMNVNKGLAVSSADGKTGDMAAYEAANEQYRQDGHKILDVTGMVAGFALDPTTWLSAGVGSAATRGAMWAGGRWLAGRGASAAVTQAATRQFATSMTGRIVGGVAGGAANFGTFEGVKEMENQFAHGGHIVGQDETGRYINEGYSAGAVAGQFGHGLMMGAAVGWLGPVSGNVSDKLVRATSSTVGKVTTRAGVYTGATLAEGTIFSVPEWIEGKRDAMDVWNDNMAMMVGFKAKHMLKSAGGVLGDLKASFDSPTYGQKNRLDFESRLRQRMDAPSDGGMGLTEDEKAELKRYGYDLRDLVESSERTGDAAEGSLIAQNAPEIVSRLTDMVTDPRISEAARAKMYYFATGRRLPMSTVMRGELIEDGDGGFIVESQGANGVITSRSFKSRKAAELELQRIKRQTELNSIEIGERYQQTADFENRLQEACRTVAAENGWDMVEVYRTCEEARRNHLRGGDKQFDEVQQNILRKVTDAMGEFEETGATDAMRDRINEKYGVDIDGAIRKEASRRTLQEQTAIDEYLNELIPDKAKEANPVEDTQAEDISNQKLLTDESVSPTDSEPIDPRFDSSTDPTPDYNPHQPGGEQTPIGRAVMKYQDRPVEVLSGRVVMMEDGTMIDNERSDTSIVIRDLATGKVEMVSPEAILSYEEYAPNATDEAEPTPTEADDPAGDVQPQSQYTSGQIKIRNSDGTETRGVLTGYVDENGNHEYYVEGDLQHLHYASDHELDNILSEYVPDEVEGEATAGKPTAPGTKADEKNDSDVSDVTDVADEVQGEVSAVAPTETPEEASAGPTALERLPKNEKGEPIFEQAENPEHGWDALVEFAEGDAATAKEIADTMAEEKRKAYEKAQKQKPKGKTPTEILASKKAISAGLAQAEQEYNLWQQMANVEQRRQNAIRAQQEAEARQRAAERAEAEKAEREAREEAARLEREALEGIPEWHLDTPENTRKRGVRRFSGQMFNRQEPVQGVVGKEVEVKFSQKDLPKGHLAVIEAPQLQPSHIQGQRNPMFFIEEAQPKNRAEAVSMFAAKEMAEGIRPQEITGSATAYTGAPTVNTRGEVIQGNNRSDALRYLWENKLPEQQQTYKQYLIDNAEQFGLDPEAVNAMQQPVLVNMLDVDDAEAIRLGQMTAQDTESGGVERIKPKNVAQKLGEDMRSFASQLLRSGDEEASFGQLVDRNGTEVLKWMAQKGVITNTQYQSAFDSKGNLTAEAKNDLQKVLYQAVFKGGSQQLEEMFDALPAKAQRAILSTAFRDMDSPFAGKMLPEIQASIAAFNQLMNDPTFAAAKKMEEALRVVGGFKRSIQLDDRFEQYMPADNYSNFALHLAAMYKANDMSQSTLASYFNQMYDLAQGKKAATLFEDADTTEYPLADVIKQVLNIDYKPAKNGNNNVANGGADVALRNQDGQGGELRGNEPPASGEQNPEGAESADRGRGIAGDGRGSGNRQTRGSSEATASQESLSKEEASGIIAEMEERAEVAPEIALTIENWDAEFGESGIVSTPIGDVKMGENQFTKLMRQGRNGKLGMVKPTLENPDIIIEDNSEAKEPEYTERKSSYVYVKTFIKPDGSRYYYFTSVTVSKDGHEVVISNQEKRRNVLTNLLIKGKLVWKHADDVSSTSDVADGLFSPQGNMSDPVSEGTDAPQTNVSDRKVNNSASEEQISGSESFAQPANSKGEQTIQTAVEAASVQVNTEPTPAQAEAGNYKKGHVTIGEFDITIENPAGSVRKGVDADGKEWSNTMANTYGYIKGTEGVDGDHIDVFLHENMDEWNGRKVFVVDQTNTDGSFDEHKVMLGFNDKDEAMAAYLANYDKTWADTHPGLRISETNIEDFNKWVQSSHRKTKPFADYTTVRKEATVVIVERGAPEAAKLRQKSSRLEIEGAEKLSAERAEEVERYVEGHYCAPIRVVADEADIRESGLSDVAVAQMMAALTEEDVPAVYCREDKKIYIFAGHKDSNVGSTLAHENFHALADAIGDARERNRMFEAYRKTLLADPKCGVYFKELWDAVINAYAPEEALEDFVGYTINRMYSAPGFIGHLERILDGDVKEYIFNKFINRIFNGTAQESSKPANQQGNSENDGRMAGLLRRGDSAGSAQTEGRAAREETGLHPQLDSRNRREQRGRVSGRGRTAGDSGREAGGGADTGITAAEAAERTQISGEPKGETKLSDHAAPVAEPKPKKRKWISDEDADEFDSLRKDLRSHFGKDGDKVQEAGADYGKPKPKQMDAEVLRMGTRMTYLMMKGGLRSFSDYCEAMKDELPDIFDEMRPHLKSLYAAAQNMEEVIELGWDEEMDDRKTVKAFDVYNFDKPGAKDIIATAQHAVDENASQQQTDQIIQTLKDQRNEQRKKEADKTSADTETIIDKAETTASQVESKLEAANSEEDAEGLSRSLDKEIEEVNKQLALLGYYEADPVDKDFFAGAKRQGDYNEAYGYMRNAERKAVQDAHRLATQLAADLGITIDPKDKVRKAKYGFGSKIARSNVAPAGGDVRISLSLGSGHEVNVAIYLEPSSESGRRTWTGDNLVISRILYTVEGGKRSRNCWADPNVTYDELLAGIRREARLFLQDESVRPASLLAPQPGEDLVDMAKRVATDKEPKSPSVEPQMTMANLFGSELQILDNQGNPIDRNGKYIVEEIKSIREMSDDDFMRPVRNVALPELPERVSDAIGADGRKPMIKKNIFGKNRDSHKDLTAEDGRRILNEVLYNPNLYGQNQKGSRPYNWIMVHLSDKNSAVVLEVNPTKEYLEIVNWHYLKGRQLEQKKRQAEREGGRILTLQESNAAGDTSQGLSFEGKGNNKSLNNKTNERTDVQPRTEGTGRGGQQPRPNEPLGEGAKHEDERTDGGRMAQRGGEHSVSDSDRGAGVSGLHQSERGVTAPRTPAAPKNTRNNHAERGTDYAPKGEKARIDANIAALELAKKLLASGATATPQEMAILRRYSGWGGLGAAFNEGNAWAPNPVNKRLREALTPEEYQAAVMSRNSAYYTPAAVIDAMWDVAKALGFKGGNIVEGSAGIGNIIGLMPTEISERSNIHAVEIDPTTGGILSLLYPDAQVEIQGFEQARIANGSVDLAITNVPFVTDLHVKDESGDSDLSKKFRDIHDFCIAKNVRKLREGGIGIFITSSGTLDKSQKLRNWLVGDKEGNADVVGVFRMNNQTFGGTAATSDIIVVRKRVNGRKSANAIDVSTVTPARTATFTDARGKTKDLPLYINRYFIEHPEHMGGEMFFGFEQGDTYRPTSIGLFPTRTADQAARMAAWVQHLADMDWSKEQGKAVAEQTSHINEALGEGVKEGSMVTDSEGNLCVARMGRAVPLALNKNKIKGRTKEECFKDYTEIKSALADVLKYQTEHDDDAGLQPLLDRLNRAYDTFVQRYGNLNKNNNLAWLRNDVDFSSIVALETYSEKGNKDGTKVKTYGKTDIFSRRVVEKESEPSPKNVKDGIIASIYKYGRIDTEYLAAQLGKSQDGVKQEIVDSGLGFVDPTTGQMEVSYEYLSGNVREKLRQAREVNEAAGGAYDANIKALEAVVPMNIPAHLIEFALGSSWIEPQLYERYVKERTELDVKLTNAGGTWHMSEPWNTDKPKNTEMGVRSEAFGILIPGHKLIEAALTNKTITVSRTVKDSDGSSHTETDPAATTACATKVDEIRQDFKDWAREQMQNDPALSMRMEEKYNEKFNNSVPKSIPDEFVPEHFGGAATTVGGKPFKLRPHQAKAVIRATTQPVLLAHEVGTGKTYTLITTAMEMRRLGTARKPMIVVQNATVGQFVASAKALYPNAKVLTLEDADRNAEGRKAFYAKIKFNDWDMIVVPQSVFERIPDSIERQAKFIQDKIEEKMLVLEQMKEADPEGKSMIVRAAEREISRLEDEMTQLASGEPQPTSGKKKKDAKKAAITRQNAEVKARELLDRATDDVEDFDSMGIDAILVDEAHEYKHLGFATAMQRGVKGVDPSPSKKSQGVFLKAQAVLEKTGGKNVVFATGTPISNTAAEIWTFMRYLIPADVMKDFDIYYFDDFVRNFGNIQQMLEFKTNGKYDEVNRFAGYFNLPELVRIWSTVADTVLTREAGGVSDKIPQMEGGKAQDIFLPQTRALRSIMKFVKEELDRYDKMTGKEKKENSHIPLVMYGIAKAAAVDARLVQSDAEDDPNSKTNEAVRQTLRTLEETKDYKGTVAIFADNYQNKASGFNLYEDIRKKLIAAGVPEEQVVVMKSGMTVKKKLEIFDKVNAGEVRVIMGSTFTLGTGVNIQERLHTLIHLDAPNRPMDYTQRNGRILRQGNLHNTWGLPVRVLRFGVEDSLDVTAYQRLKTKGAIADSIMNGKQLLANSMENRSLEEDQDLFGDITAQLSGSEYAMLKNQIEKEVRKLRAAEKNWKADQTYIHNRKRQIVGQNREAEKRIAEYKAYLEKVEAATIGNITVGKLFFPSVEAMEDFFTEQNKKKAAMQEQVRTSGYSSRPATSDITISVGGFDFNIHTEITKEMKHQQGDLFATAPAKMTYSCPDLGIDAMPVRGNAIKNAVLDIMENVVSGKDFRERIANAENYLERNNAELEAISKRDGQPFKDAEALEKAEEKLAEYEELMKAEMAAKEAKYAEMDKDVEAAAGIELTEEDSEPTASEPDMDYSAENANFVSRYETKDGKTVRYTSENPEAYGGLFDFDFTGAVPGADNAAEGGRVNRRQQSNPPLQRRNAALLDTNASDRLNEANGEYCALERKFRESNYMEFTSAEKVESADDVAFIFEELENASVENVFVVMTKRGVPTVMHISIGGFNWSAMNAAPVKLAFDRIKPDKVYFVHNHPSGALNCSAQDVNCLKQIEGAIGKKAEGVIMNLKSGKYGTFDSSGTDSSASHDKAPAPAVQRRLRLYAFDRHVFNPDYQPSANMRSAEDVAKFLSSHRLGDRSKVSVLVCNNQNQIVANVHTTHISIDSKGLAEDIIRAIGEFGGMHAFLYGDFEQSGMVAYRNLTQAVKERSGGVYNLLDVVRIEGNHTWSARDNGYVCEPGSEYGASPEGKSSHAEKLAKKFNTPIQLVTDSKELTSDNAERQARMRRSKGFYDPATGKVVVVLPNNANVEDVAETVFHEVVAHKGLREMLGEENYDAFCDEVYNHLKDDLKEEVDRETTRRFEREPEKGYEHHRRVSVDEMFGRMAEKGFEDFTKAEIGIWAKLKAKVLEAINKFLGSLRLPKWVKLGDNELRYMLWRSHEKLRSRGSTPNEPSGMDYVDMARDAAKREELGLNKSEVIVTRSKKTTADRIEEAFDAAVSGDLKGKPLEVGKLTQEGRAYLEKLSGEKMKENVSFVLNPSDLVHIYRRHYGKNEKDGRNIPLTNEDVRQISEIVSSPDRIVFGKEKNGNQRNMFFFLKEANDGSYNLMEVYSDKKGNLTAKSFFKSKEGVSQRAMLLNESSTLTSVTDGATLLDGAKLPKFFESATDSEEESYDFRFRDGETGDIWKDQSVGLQERITNAAIRLSNNQSSDLTLRNDAQKAVINNLQILLHSMRNRRGTAQSFVGADRKVEAGVVGAMNAQAMFDRATVKRVSDLARILMQNGYLSGMTSGEMQRLLSVVKNATAMHDISDSVQKIMDIMVNNQLRNAEGALRQLMQVRGSKVDARGVEVQGVLDVDGQRTMEVVKKAMSLSEDDITDRIAEALNRMGDPDQTIADQAALEYAGLNMALDYVQNIANSKAEEKALRDSLKTAKEDRDAGRMTDDAYKQFVEAAEDAIRKNKIERAEAYFNLVGRLSDSLRESIENAKAFREAEKARVSEIHHNANSDMEGRPTNEHHKDDWKDKFVNNGFVQFLFAPLGTFDQILRVFGNKNANGEGYLWNRFMRGWVDCRNKELTGVKEKFARLDEKAAELFGKGKTWGNLIRMEAKMPKATVSFWDGGEMRDHELTQGNLLYIYMVDKMTDGRMKLRRMGITEDDITRIENFLDPRFKALGDWLQDEFLVDTRNEYNETHKRMFGASMAAIENYFPLKILANARVDKEEDVNQQNRPDGITTKTGSIIKRRVNNLALDITGADALSVILDHITQMEHWSAYVEWNRDLNTLRTYKRFRNQVINMTTVYGGGHKLWEKFNNLCLMAAGEYRPPVSMLNKSAVNLAKGVTAAKVSFRMYTALKQLLSAPAYIPEVSTAAIAKSIANPYGDFKWCLENMPIFRERWHSRISGDPRLLKSDMDWKMWRSRIMEISSRIGMTANAFVDAVTVSIGARAMYETRLKQYLKEGYPADAAEKRAMQDAAILFNQTQQSSESPFLSTMQVDKDWLSTLFTVFRNSSMSYTRQEFDAVRNLKRNLTPGQRAKSIEFMTKQILRDWDVDPDTATDAERDQAEGAAKKRFRRQIKKDVLRLATFGFILELAWNLGPYLPYIIFGNNEDEKDKMWDDAMTHAYFGSVEGLTGGDVMSSFGNMWASGEWNWNQLSKDMPLASDINTIGSKYLKGKNAEAINDILNLLVQMGVGMNPQSITDTAIAITDACGDDPALSHEAAIFAMRVLQVPQSQIDKMYFDEVDLTGEEASKLTPAQLAQRYAEYKVKRGTPLAPWSWGDEERLGKYNDLATDRMKERLNAQGDAKVIEAYSDFEARYKAVSEKAKEAKELMKTDYAAAAQAHAALQQAPDFGLYQRFGALDNQLGRISKMWLTAKTPEEATLVASTLSDYRAAMVGALQAETAEDQQSAMSELTTLMTDFYTKYQGMQPKRVP